MWHFDYSTSQRKKAKHTSEALQWYNNCANALMHVHTTVSDLGCGSLANSDTPPAVFTYRRASRSMGRWAPKTALYDVTRTSYTVTAFPRRCHGNTTHHGGIVAHNTRGYLERHDVLKNGVRYHSKILIILLRNSPSKGCQILWHYSVFTERYRSILSLVLESNISSMLYLLGPPGTVVWILDHIRGDTSPELLSVVSDNSGAVH